MKYWLWLALSVGVVIAVVNLIYQVGRLTGRIEALTEAVQHTEQANRHILSPPSKIVEDQTGRAIFTPKDNPKAVYSIYYLRSEPNGRGWRVCTYPAGWDRMHATSMPDECDAASVDRLGIHR